VLSATPPSPGVCEVAAKEDNERGGSKGRKKNRRFDVQKMLTGGMWDKGESVRDEYLQEVLERASSD
jgi:hypothetical protein